MNLFTVDALGTICMTWSLAAIGAAYGRILEGDEHEALSVSADVDANADAFAEKKDEHVEEALKLFCLSTCFYLVSSSVCFICFIGANDIRCARHGPCFARTSRCIFVPYPLC